MCVLHSPSALLRQQVLRVLLPPLLLQKDGSSKRLERVHALSSLYHLMWEEGVRQCNLPTGAAASVAALSPFVASPFLGDTFLSDLLVQQPQLAHLYDVLCALFPDMLVAAAADAAASARSDSQSSDVDAWVLDVVLVSSNEAGLQGRWHAAGTARFCRAGRSLTFYFSSLLPASPC